MTLTRTLWRSGESEYAINQTPCRLLDIQELLSDSGVGRTQHMMDDINETSVGVLNLIVNTQGANVEFQGNLQ